MAEYGGIWASFHGYQTPQYLMRRDGQRIADMHERHRRRRARKAKRIENQARLKQAATTIEQSLVLATAIQRLLTDKGVLSSEEIKCATERLRQPHHCYSMEELPRSESEVISFDRLHQSQHA